MKLLYSGASFCDEPVFKRLLVVAEEIHFMDRPSVTFKNWGTIGHETLARRIDSSGDAVTIHAEAPPSGPGHWLYNQYIEADARNNEFVRTVIEGFKTSDLFAAKFVQPNANYHDGINGKYIIDALRSEEMLFDGKLSLAASGPNLFDVSSPGARRHTFKTILIEASIIATSSVLVAEKVACIPVTEDPYVAKLIAMRTSIPAYISGDSRVTPFIALALVESVLPDTLLANISIRDILKYRERTKHAYARWSIEVNRVAAKIAGTQSGISRDEIQAIIASELTPKISEYQIEMSAIRDEMFASIIKKVSTWEFPTISLAYLANIGFAGAIAAFASALLPAGRDVVDYFVRRREVERGNAMAFLLGLSKKND